MKPHRRLRLFILIFLAEALLCLSIFAPKLNDTSSPLQTNSPRISVFRARPVPVIKKKPEEMFETLKPFVFDGRAALSKWEEKVFKGKTLYEFVGEGPGAFLRATSSGASSGMYLKDLDIRPSPDLYLEWEWRAVEFPKKENASKLSNRREDDFAARIYVVFPGSSFFKSNVIEYIWDESLPVGTLESSPFSGRVKLFVIRSGHADKAENEGWRVERRNIYQDYLEFFGDKQEKNMGAIGFMSDSDNTGKKSEAHFKRMAILKKKLELNKEGLNGESKKLAH